MQSGARDLLGSQVLGGPPQAVLEEVHRLYRVSVRRCWAEIRGTVAVGAGGVGYEQKLSAKPVEQRPPAAGLHWWSE